MKIGFTTDHKESLIPNAHKNFLKFSHFLKKTGLELDSINLNEDSTDYQMIIVGAPERPFRNTEFNQLRQYANNGGNLFIVLKWGGDDKLGTNLSELFECVSTNNDIVVSQSNYLKKRHQPIIELEINAQNLDFKGPVVYDGGCTFNVSGDVEFVGYPKSTYGIIEKPRWNGYSYNGIEKTDKRPVLVYKKIGEGTVIYWGCRWSFSDEIFNEYGNSTLFRKLLTLMLGQNTYDTNVYQRMQRTQRHRLLHGFPMPQASKFIRCSLSDSLKEFNLDNEKPLALGIIGHPMCNPQIRGCGYCPFPHENYNAERMKISINAVINELKSLDLKYPRILNRKISSVYFGGGTANLTDSDLFKKLCGKLKEKLNFSKDTEITLEGAPSYFVQRKELLQIMRDCFMDSDLRISLGIQTFDDDILRLAGRSRMNTPGSVDEAVKISQELDFRVSADFLFNLPGRNYDSINSDLNHAIELGLEHICWYHLVVENGMNTEWSEDNNILSNLPSKNQSLNNWISLYYSLKEHQYEPITVTDFKLRKRSQGNYQYEEDLRNPDKVDWLGLGSYAISLLSNNDFSRAIKLMNPNSLDSYIERQRIFGLPWQSIFKYNSHDIRLFWLTRKVKGTKIIKNDYLNLFGTNIYDDYGPEITALQARGLIEDNGNEYKLSPEGFFYADTIAAHLAWMRVNELSSRCVIGRVVKKKADGSFVEYSYDGERWENESIQNFMG
jgi:coproporphyrinogen III oxidase-like Fe-S oxidoreductase